MKKVAIIGAGIFGCTAAIALATDYEVHVYERAQDILQGASTSNHLRYHMGYHYPRSPETVSECIIARKAFEREYGKSVQRDFPAYYGVSKDNTKTSPDAFLAFCDKMGLPYILEFPEERFMNREKVALAVKTTEEVYDPEILKKIVREKLSNKNIFLHLNTELVRAEMGNKKNLTFRSKGREEGETFDVIINATYTNLNAVNKILSLPVQEVFYEFVELLEVSVQGAPRIGLTIVDGEFSSLLPRGAKSTFTFGHVKQSILKEQVSTDPNKIFSQTPVSNREGILREGIIDYPFLKDAKVVRSIFIPRVVKAHVDATDKRPTEITDYGYGCYSIFAGKVITAVTTAEKLKSVINTTQK